MTAKKKPLLIEANDIIHGARKKAYGDASKSFNCIAAQWNLYLIQKYCIEPCITAEDVCWMMADLKKVRAMHAAARDNVLDACGYLGLIDEVLP